jgi:sugar phosphate isomerase/epimerase
LGYGQGAQFWADFVSALRSAGYDGVLSIEHEDPLMDSEEAIGRAVEEYRTIRTSVSCAGAPPPF